MIGVYTGMMLRLRFFYLLAKFIRPEDSEMTIRSSSRCHLSTTPVKLHTIMLSAKQGSCEYYFLKSFGMTRQEN